MAAKVKARPAGKAAGFLCSKSNINPDDDGGFEVRH